MGSSSKARAAAWQARTAEAAQRIGGFVATDEEPIAKEVKAIAQAIGLPVPVVVARMPASFLECPDWCVRILTHPTTGIPATKKDATTGEEIVQTAPDLASWRKARAALKESIVAGELSGMPHPTSADGKYLMPTHLMVSNFATYGGAVRAGNMAVALLCAERRDMTGSEKGDAQFYQRVALIQQGRDVYNVRAAAEYIRSALSTLATREKARDKNRTDATVKGAIDAEADVHAACRAFLAAWSAIHPATVPTAGAIGSAEALDDAVSFLRAGATSLAAILLGRHDAEQAAQAAQNARWRAEAAEGAQEAAPATPAREPALLPAPTRVRANGGSRRNRVR